MPAKPPSKRTRKNINAANRRNGAEWEEKVSLWLAAQLNHPIERRKTNGVLDRGDLAGIRGWIGECKSHAGWEPSWLEEAAREAVNDAARTCVPTRGFVFKRRRGKPDPADGVILLSPEVFVSLLIEARGGPT